MNEKLLFLIPLIPLAFAAANFLLGHRLSRHIVNVMAVMGVGASTIMTLILWPLSAGQGTRAELFTWLDSGDLRVPMEILFDPLSASMTLMVTFVATMIHIYAVGYMEKEGDYPRFFGLMNLFVFSMLTIVLADNLLVLFLGWEGVGFCSYALIGFWYLERKNPGAGRKAFLVTRLGDVFLAIAMLWLFSLFGTLSISTMNAAAADIIPPATATALVLLLLAGACGKSAQIPLMIWLPDAMAGPTPVSALIHAATMVTGGVYLLSRLFPIVELSPTGMMVIAAVGAFTALYAALCAIGQREIKRVLAYSTMSQGGYMFMAVGAGTVSGAMFHLFTHAFFKALLFLGAGCIIHLAGERNDIYRMGGLAGKDKLVFWSFIAGALSLAGAPLSAGYFSKDGILVASLALGGIFYQVILAFAAITALLTAYYTFRLVYLVFAGKPREDFGDTHVQLPAVMRWSLPPLAVLGLFGGVINLPPLYGGTEGLRTILGPLAGFPHEVSHAVELIVSILAAALFLAGWFMAQRQYRQFPGEELSPARNFLLEGWHADRLAGILVVRPFEFLGRVFHGIDLKGVDGSLEALGEGCQQSGQWLRRFTSGRVSTYLTAFAFGLVVMLGWVLVRML
jgi:NADH-quinone oxidoreductase subunit L